MTPLGRLARHPTGRVVLTVLAVLGILCALAPVLAPGGPEAGSLSETLRRPDARHWLGTDELGRDVLARLLWGGRVSLSVALLVTLVAPALGTAYGWSPQVRRRGPARQPCGPSTGCSACRACRFTSCC